MGGYILIDFKNVNITGTPGVKIDGIYERMKDAYNCGKLILAYNLIVGNNIYDTVAIDVRSAGNTYVFYFLSQLNIITSVTIDDSDNVFFTNKNVQ